MRPGGRLVMLSPSKQLMASCLQQQAALWEAQRTIDVNCGGAIACVTLWQRTAEPAPAAPIEGKSGAAVTAKEAAAGAMKTKMEMVPQLSFWDRILACRWW